MGEPNGAVLSEPVIDSQVATSVGDAQEVPRLLKDVAANGDAFNSDNSHDARMKLLDSARDLVYSLETPREALIRHIWTSPVTYPTLEAALNIGAFSALSKDDEPKDIAELAKATGAEPKLLGRLLKHLSTVGVVKDAGPNKYRPTSFCKALTIKRFSDGVLCMPACVNDGLYALPVHLQKIGLKDPVDPLDTPFATGYKTNLSFFQFLGDNMTVGSQFNNLMATYRQGRPSWMDHGFYPVQERLIDGASTASDAAFLVDVGGSVGHDIEEFHQKWPNAPGRLVLQDQKAVLDDAKDLNTQAIEPMVHDFFTEQPVKGARAYYMHSVLHDWTDEKAVQILSRLAESMTPGYSKILINENVIPDTDAYWESTTLDILMMSLFSSRERTEQDWRALVASAGLKIANIYTMMKGVESVIECELV